MNRLLASGTLFCLALLTATAQGAEADYRQLPFQLPASIDNLLVADTNGDGLKDLIAVVDDSIRVYFQDAAGFDFVAGYDEVMLPGTAVGWDLSRQYGANATIIALVDGSEVLAWPIAGRRIQPPVSVLSALNGYLAQGINRLHFSRDVNADERADLIIPGPGELQLHLRTPAGDYARALHIKSDVRLNSNLESHQLERRIGQAIVIPALELRDVNGDGVADIVSRTEERLDVFLASASSADYFPGSPSYSLDITAIEERLGDFDVDSLDFSNLTGVLALTHEEILEDVDGDGIDDLLLREGGKVSLFGGTIDGMDMQQPRQVLRSSGNVLSTFLYDEDADGLKDLWLWRVESISVGDIFVWLALSGSISIEAFIYPNEGPRFARRPVRQITVELKFPSVIRLASSFQEIRDEVLEADTGTQTPIGVANIDDDRSRQDLLVLLERQLQVFLNVIDPAPAQRPFLGSLGYSRERDDYEIDIRRVLDDLAANEDPRLQRVAGRQADYTIDLPTTARGNDVIPAQLNNDARDDLFVFTDFDSSHINGILLLSIDSPTP